MPLTTRLRRIIQAFPVLVAGMAGLRGNLACGHLCLGCLGGLCNDEEMCDVMLSQHREIAGNGPRISSFNSGSEEMFGILYRHIVILSKVELAYFVTERW